MAVGDPGDAKDRVALAALWGRFDRRPDWPSEQRTRLRPGRGDSEDRVEWQTSRYPTGRVRGVGDEFSSFKTEIIGVRNSIINPAVTREQREHQYNKRQVRGHRQGGRRSAIGPSVGRLTPASEATETDATPAGITTRGMRVMRASQIGWQVWRSPSMPPCCGTPATWTPPSPDSAPRATASRTRTSRVFPRSRSHLHWWSSRL